ncbi:hypothetical protein [Dubosiella newyorkensis]|uniref:hypothetical protein n=1 Tax=Dubosiella newyorkensis TaxID=1862672 RepID=UPI003F68195A
MSPNLRAVVQIQDQACDLSQLNYDIAQYCSATDLLKEDVVSLGMCMGVQDVRVCHDRSFKAQSKCSSIF